MSPAWQNLAPLSEAVTNNIKVEVLSQYSPENSHPTQGEWVFEYTVRIEWCQPCDEGMFLSGGRFLAKLS